MTGATEGNVMALREVDRRWHPAKAALTEAGVTKTLVAKVAGVRPASVNHMMDVDANAVSPKVRRAIVELLDEAGYGKRKAEALFK